MNTRHLFIFRTLKRIIDIPAQQKLQSEYLRKSYRSYLIDRLKKHAFYRFLYGLEVFRIFLFSVLKMKEEGQNKDLVYLVSTRNQARQIDFVRALFPDKDFKSFDLQNEKPVGLDFIRYLSALFCSLYVTLLYLCKAPENRDAITSVNYILYLCTEAFFRRVFVRLRPKAVLVANDHSALPLGFSEAARYLNIKTIYIQHAYITHDFPPLRFDLALLDGQCALDTYAVQGASQTSVAFRGLEGVERPMKTEALTQGVPLTVGLFLNVFYEEKLKETLMSLENQPGIQRIVVRPHPAYPVDLSFLECTKVELSSREKTLWEDADACDVVIGGNSSFHLSVLKYGVPTLYYNDIDYVNYDDYSFVKNKICYEITSPKDLNFSKAAEFYADPDWKKRFSYLDASYGRDQEKINAETRAAIEKQLS